MEPNKEPIRVLQMTASLYTGGSQMMITNLYKQIDRNKIQFDFIIDHPDLIELKPLVESLGAKVYIMPKFNGINIFSVKKAWKDFFKNYPEYKIIHSHSRSYASIYLKIAKKHELKTIIHSHNTSNGKGIKSNIKNLLQKELRNVADYFIGCSYDSGKWLFGEKIASSNKFYILNNAIDANKFRFNREIRDRYRKDFNLLDEDVYIQVGELNDQKNHLFSIELFKVLVSKNPNSKLYVVGDGENRKVLENKIKEYHLDNNVIMLGRRNDVNCLLQMADYYIMPSNFEGLSVAAIEAQASGIKCLLSDKVSKDVKITENVDFIALDIEEWIKKIENSTYQRKDTYEDIVKAGYDIKTTAKWLEEFYLGLVK